MRGVQSIDLDPDNQDVAETNESIFAETNITAVGPLTITALAAAAGVGRQITMDNETASEENNTATWTITGTDADGRAMQETLTGVSDGVTASTKYFNTVTAIEIGGTIETQITAADIGTNGVVVSKTFLLDKYAVNAPLIDQTLTGAMAWSVEICLESPADEATAENQGAVTWVPDADHTAISASQLQNLADWPAAGLRIITQSYTNGGELAVRISQGY
jgi:hypothetical protein